jgi:UDP:flavonoid glycosyltransferase YjiC (YdhE family)
MSRILLAWELGAASGHLAGLRPLVEGLLARGHQVTLAAQNLRNAARVFAGLDFPIVPAPRTHELYGGLQDPPLNYSEILMRYGYIDAPMLAALVRAWRALMQLTAADVLVADHAPTALLAARGLQNLRCIAFGNSFAVPPDVHPTPNMRRWLDVPQQRLLNSDTLVLETINQSLPSSADPLSAVHQLFDRADRMFVGIPELDPYGPRQAGFYLGLYLGISGKAAANWPAGEGKRIFAYLRADYTEIDHVLTALSACGARCLIHMAGASQALIKRYHSSRLVFSDTPVDIASAATQCDAAICHSGTGTVNALLQAQLEQFLLARNVDALGAGIVVVPEEVKSEFGKALQSILENPSFSGYARTLANRYREPSMQAMLDHAIARIEGRVAEALT